MFSEFPVRAQQWRDFASAHSCGLRLDPRALTYNTRFLCHSAFVRVATPRNSFRCNLSASLPQRIRAGCDETGGGFVAIELLFASAHSCGLRLHGLCCLLADGVLCHSAFVRVATFADLSPRELRPPLPQRIRAGCDTAAVVTYTAEQALPQRIRAGCDG